MELSKILPLYIGQRIMTHKEFIPNRPERTEVPGVCILTTDLLADLLNGTFPGSIGSTWKLILRRTQDIYSEEMSEGPCPFMHIGEKGIYYTPEGVIFLTSRGIDLYGLIDFGQAIDAATIEKEKGDV